MAASDVVRDDGTACSFGVTPSSSARPSRSCAPSTTTGSTRRSRVGGCCDGGIVERGIANNMGFFSTFLRRITSRTVLLKNSTANAQTFYFCGGASSSDVSGKWSARRAAHDAMGHRCHAHCCC